jgi:predicted Zn-dependent protease
MKNNFTIFAAIARKLMFTALASLLAAGCLRNPVTHKSQTKLISDAAERRIGEETKTNILKEFGELKDPVLGQYVTNVGQRLVAVSDRPRVAYEFLILDTEMINAFAAPGGFIFVTRGLLEGMQSEAELASVLGHEIVHVAGWHSVGMIQRQMGYGALTSLGAIATGIGLGPEAMLMVAQTGQLFTELYLLGYSREHELEADRVGIRYMISAGYDPREALSFFERLAALEKKEGPDDWDPYFRSHPPTPARIEQAKAYMNRPFFFRRKGERGEAAYQEMKTRLPRLKPEERGQVTGRRFVQELYGVSLAIPEEWGWEPQSAQAIVGFRKTGGEAWGELRRAPVSGARSAEAFAEAFAGEKKWQFIQGRQVLYPAGYGFLGQFYGQGPLGGVYVFRVFFIVRDGAGWALLCASVPDRTWEYLVPFEQILRSFELR